MSVDHGEVACRRSHHPFDHGCREAPASNAADHTNVEPKLAEFSCTVRRAVTGVVVDNDHFPPDTLKHFHKTAMQFLYVVGFIERRNDHRELDRAAGRAA